MAPEIFLGKFNGSRIFLEDFLLIFSFRNFLGDFYPLQEFFIFSEKFFLQNFHKKSVFFFFFFFIRPTPLTPEQRRIHVKNFGLKFLKENKFWCQEFLGKNFKSKNYEKKNFGEKILRTKLLHQKFKGWKNLSQGKNFQIHN